ncbi:MAG: hypothetical protein CL693_03895 [Cellvibrionaceae bacterium]|nr:hypothetical protein [Cellvibrionaceae bacterium]|tara:strand:- start:2331 stop:3485 length:1155 start_codon:yes stop_codon:yes gene_type:complete
MKKTLLTPCLLAATIATSAQAADIRFNGFASVVAGMTTSEGSAIVRNAMNPAIIEGTTDATFVADNPSSGVYDDDISFKPDTIFGLQVSANLGSGLTVTGQFTGAGGEDFDANVAWAYISYELSDSWTLVAGRQRLPFFFYSDFLDVGYAYHWMRPPVETQVAVDTLDGIQFRHEGSAGSWDTRVQLYGGVSDNDSETLGDEVNLENAVGAVFYASNDWLQLRATHMVTDFYLDAAGEIFGQGEDDTVDADFTGFAAHMTLGNGFIVAEYVTYEFDDAIQPVGWTTYEGAYISGGYRIGDFTPHITFSTENQEVEDSVYAAAGLTDGDDSSDSITLGVRWDFHPQAAFKVEYQARSDESDDNIEAYYGDRNEVDVVSVGFDVIF